MDARRRKTRGSFVRRLALWVGMFSAACFGAGTVVFYFFLTPDVDEISAASLNETSILYDRTGTYELYRFYGEENRIVIPHDAIPDTVRQATIAAEDANFYSHNGLDPIAILRALKINLLSGDIEQGASTITQQLARSLFLNRQRSWERKIREAFLAIKIDANFDKDQILDLYLNAIPYGSNAYGIEAAAQTFFHKSARELSLDESILLAALPNSPSGFSPYGSHTKTLVSRQKDITRKMLALGFISEADAEAVVDGDTLARVKPLERRILAPHFVFYILDELAKTYGKERLQTEGLRIHSTLDYDLQLAAERAVRNGAEKNIPHGANNAALVALDAKNGDVLAMVGSKDYFDTSIDGNVNVTVRTRQPGSSFKPFAYATAFEKGFQPETPLYDIPIDFGPDGTGERYIPNNYDGRFHGLLTMRQALSMSLNIPAVQTLALAGVNDTAALATRMGITTLADPSRYGLALVLGGAEVKPIDMASAFSVFSQEGLRHPINPLSKILDREGNETLPEKKDGERVLDPEIARKINSILSDNAARTPTFGPNSPLAFPKDVAVAAKTGTTQNFRDAWTVGYTPSVAVAVWVGNNDNQPMKPGSDGVYVAAPIWREFMNAALRHFPETGFIPYQPLDPSLQINVKLGNGKTLYFDKKTGREISKKEAKKMKKDRVEKYDIDTFSPGGVGGFSEYPDTPGPLVPFESIRPMYIDPVSSSSENR